MRYWVRRKDGAVSLVLRAFGDPFNDPDVVPSYYRWSDGQWVEDERMLDDLLWDPNFREVSVSEVDSVVGVVA